MEKYKEKVYFIGAGPGDPELITIKGQRIVKEADVIIYAGSLKYGLSISHCGKKHSQSNVPSSHCFEWIFPIYLPAVQILPAFSPSVE